MEEEFRNIPEYNYIQVSNKGRVYNIKTKQYIGYEKVYNHLSYKVISIGKKCLKIHRLVAQLFIPNHTNKPFVDHIDGNGLNNDISNLRWATNQENNRNQKLSNNNKLGIKGIQQRENGKYRARIRIDGRLISLGTFDSIEEAKQAREKASKDYFKEFQSRDDKI